MTSPDDTWTDPRDAPQPHFIDECPFCRDGAPVLVLFPEGNPRHGMWQVQCSNYFCMASGGAMETAEQAVAVWNRRDGCE